MSFTVHDFHEMTQLFYRNPEFRAELRRLVLTDEMLNLPEQMRTISQDIHELYEISKRHDARLGNLESDVSVLKSDVAVLKSDVADIKGDLLESRVRERVFTYLSRFARRLRLVARGELSRSPRYLARARRDQLGRFADRWPRCAAEGSSQE